MKKTLLATGILAAMLSTSSIAATVYTDGDTSFQVNGRAEARFNIQNQENASDFTDKSRARVSFEGQTGIADGFHAFGKYELEVGDNDANDQDTFETRYLYAGVGSEYGSFSYGQQDTVAVILTDYTDTMATFGGEADLLDGLNASDQVENNFAYVGTFNALTVGANYVVAENNEEDQYTLGAAYAFDFGLEFGAGYYGTKDADAYLVSAKYGYDAFTFGAMFNAASFDNGAGQADTDYMGYEVSAQYDLDKFTFVATYNYKEEEGANGAQDVELVDAIAVEGVYKFNSNFRTYVGYKFDQMENADDQLQAGLRYDF